MLIDAQGLTVTTEAPEAVETINQFADELLSYGKRVDIILKGWEADPTSPLVNAYVAAFYLSIENMDSLPLATPYLQTAQHEAVRATEREQWTVAAIAAWAAGDFHQALTYHQVLAESYPRDLISAYLAQYHHLFSGDGSKGLLKIVNTIFSANQTNSYVHGMLAFALEQNHQLAAAEAAGRRAVEMNPADPWAHHAVAHVLETLGQPRAGITWLESVADTWERCGIFACHNWWHLALYYLALKDVGRVLELYDQKIWGQAIRDYGHCQVNAISLLLRLELQGADVGDRWEEIGPYLPPQIHNHFLPLTDLHLFYGLARSGQLSQVEEMLNSLERYAANSRYPLQLVWGEVVLPVARGLIAHAEGQWSRTITYLEPIWPQLWRVGGSHAQRQLFHQVYQDAQRRSRSSP